LTAALIDIKKHGQTPKLGDINPQNVFVNDDGHIRVANVYSWPHERYSYWKVLENEKH
jgi:serine/threonine protein kinase